MDWEKICKIMEQEENRQKSLAGRGQQPISEISDKVFWGSKARNYGDWNSNPQKQTNQMKQKLKHSLKIVVVGIMTFSLTGCASIISGSTKHVSVKSEPSDAKVTVYDQKGEAILVQQTPAILALKSGHAYFNSYHYHLVIEKEGYQKAEIDLKPTLNGWYFGNFIFGGLIGLLIVDPCTGAMYTLTPKNVSVVLQQQHASIQTEKNGLVVMLRKDVPAEFASQLVPISVQ